MVAVRYVKYQSRPDSDTDRSINIIIDCVPVKSKLEQPPGHLNFWSEKWFKCPTPGIIYSLTSCFPFSRCGVLCACTPCFYRVIQTLVKVWENLKKLWKHSRVARGVSITRYKHGTCFLFLTY